MLRKIRTKHTYFAVLLLQFKQLSSDCVAKFYTSLNKVKSLCLRQRKAPHDEQNLVSMKKRIRLDLYTIARISVFAFHSFNGHYPLLAELAHVNTVYELAVGDCFAERALVKSPEFSRVTKCKESVEGGINLNTVLPKLVTRKVELIIPNDTVATYVNSYRSKYFRLLLERSKERYFVKQRLDVVNFCYTLRELNREICARRSRPLL